MNRTYLSSLLLIISSYLVFKTSAQFKQVAVKIYQGNTSATLLSIVNLKNNRSISEIMIEEENVPLLTSNTFEGIYNLHEIIIRRTNLKHLEQFVFRGLPLLRSINLNENQIEEIPYNVFNNLRLNRLALRANGIKRISARAFSNLPNLVFLDLAENNIEAIPQDLFRNTGNLKTLDLSYNKLRHYPAIPYRPYSHFEQAFANAVQYENTLLDLSCNNFTFISYYLLRGIHFIKELKLNGNNINLISDYAFDDLKWAGVLNFEDNDLREINDNLLYTLEVAEKIEMADNPWKENFVCKYTKFCELHKKENTMDDKCHIREW